MKKISKLDHSICGRSFTSLCWVRKNFQGSFDIKILWNFPFYFLTNWEIFSSKFSIIFLLFVPESEEPIANDQVARENQWSMTVPIHQQLEREMLWNTRKMKRRKRSSDIFNWILEKARRVTRAKENYMKTIEVV